MFEYRVGDTVRIKSEKWYNRFSNQNGEISSEIVPFGFNVDMAKYCGMVGTITNATRTIYHDKEIKKYRLDIDRGDWIWGIDMFEIGKKGMDIE